MLSKHFFSSYDAGIYSSAAVIGKAVIYLPGAIVISLFPIVSAENARDKNTLHILYKAVLITFIFSGSGVMLLLFFPDIVIKFLFGQKYIPAIGIVGFYSIAMFPIGLITILMNYFLARGEVKFVYSLAGALSIEIIGIYLYHTNIKHILFSILISGIFALLIFSVFILYEYRNVSLKDNSHA